MKTRIGERKVDRSLFIQKLPLSTGKERAKRLKHHVVEGSQAGTIAGIFFCLTRHTMETIGQMAGEGAQLTTIGPSLNCVLFTQ